MVEDGDRPGDGPDEASDAVDQQWCHRAELVELPDPAELDDVQDEPDDGVEPGQTRVEELCLPLARVVLLLLGEGPLVVVPQVLAAGVGEAVIQPGVVLVQLVVHGVHGCPCPDVARGGADEPADRDDPVGRGVERHEPVVGHGTEHDEAQGVAQSHHDDLLDACTPPVDLDQRGVRVLGTTFGVLVGEPLRVPLPVNDLRGVTPDAGDATDHQGCRENRVAEREERSPAFQVKVQIHRIVPFSYAQNALPFPTRL